jgi:hypothetical protein
MSEFNMLATEMGDDETESRDALGGPSIMIVTKGRGKMKVGGKEHDLDEGYVLFIGVGKEITFEAFRGLQIFTAFVEWNALMLQFNKPCSWFGSWMSPQGVCRFYAKRRGTVR